MTKHSPLPGQAAPASSALGDCPGLDTMPWTEPNWTVFATARTGSACSPSAALAYTGSLAKSLQRSTGPAAATRFSLVAPLRCLPTCIPGHSLASHSSPHPPPRPCADPAASGSHLPRKTEERKHPVRSGTCSTAKHTSRVPVSLCDLRSIPDPLQPQFPPVQGPYPLQRPSFPCPQSPISLGHTLHFATL